MIRIKTLLILCILVVIFSGCELNKDEAIHLETTSSLVSTQNLSQHSSTKRTRQNKLLINLFLKAHGKAH